MDKTKIKIDPLLDEDKLWIDNFIINDLRFIPDVNPQSAFLPFRLQRPFTVYDISGWMQDESVDTYDLIAKALCNSLPVGHKLYSIDWQHNCVLYDPRNMDTAYSAYDAYPRHTASGIGYFNDFYPDGDYYFFIEKYGRFGYLSHPWREEVWIFGTTLLQEFDKIHTTLGWKVKASIK